MQVFVSTTAGSGVWYVKCSDPWIILGPFPTERMAFDIKAAIDKSYVAGLDEIRSGIKDLLGLDNVGN